MEPVSHFVLENKYSTSLCTPEGISLLLLLEMTVFSYSDILNLISLLTIYLFLFKKCNFLYIKKINKKQLFIPLSKLRAQKLKCVY